MKKTVSVILIIVLVAALCAVFSACDEIASQEKPVSLVAVELNDAPYSDCALAVKKGDTSIKTKINEVLLDLTRSSLSDKGSSKLEQYMAYYEKLASKGSADKGTLKTEWTDGDSGTLNFYVAIGDPEYTEGQAPYCFVFKGEYVGLELVIMHEVAERMDLTLNIVTPAYDASGNPDWPDAELYDKLNADAGYACAGGRIIVSSSRKSECDFSNIYDQIPNGIVSSNGDCKSLLDLNGKRVAVVRGGHNQESLESALSPSGLAGCGALFNETYHLRGTVIVPYVSYGYEACIEALKRGEVDAVLAPYAPLRVLLAKSSN